MIKDERNYHQRLQEFCDCFIEHVSLGLRNDRIELTFQFERTEGGENFSIFFPEI
jgi:hypothetical protein